MEPVGLSYFSLAIVICSMFFLNKITKAITGTDAGGFAYLSFLGGWFGSSGLFVVMAMFFSITPRDFIIDNIYGYYFLWVLVSLAINIFVREKKIKKGHEKT